MSENPKKDSEKNCLIIVSGGSGDCLLGFQCAELLKNKEIYQNVDLLCCVRPAVYEILETLFDGTKYQYCMSRHSDGEKWGENHWILNNQELLKQYTGPFGDKYDVFYYVVPDLLFRNPLAFDYKRYDISLSSIKEVRILRNEWAGANSKKIVVNLNTTTLNYDYKHTFELVKYLAEEELPDYEILVPLITEWAGIPISFDKRFVEDKLKDNIKVILNPSIKQSIDDLKYSCFGIFTDNGMSHVAFQLGMERLLLTCRFGDGIQSLAWESRWYENGFQDQIHNNTNPRAISDLVATLIKIPETRLISKFNVLNNLHQDWSHFLFFKY